MGGFVRGKIECFMCNKDGNYNVQNMFKNIYDFFSSHPQYTLHSLNFGATNGPAAVGAGTGTGYVDSVSSTGGTTFGNNAWFVFRQNASPARPFDVYHLFQWNGAANGTRGATFGTSPGNPGFISFNGNANTTQIGYACAIGISGSGGTTGSYGNFGDPWKGTAAALTGSTAGSDTKGQAPVPVWGTPIGGTGVMIFPRANNGPNGTYQQASSQNANNCQQMGTLWEQAYTTTGDCRQHIVADDDSFIIYIDAGDGSTNNALFYAGMYIPRGGIPASFQSNLTPYVVLCDGIDTLGWNANNESIWGDTAGTANKQGGIIGNTTASVRSVVLDFPVTWLNDINMQPNNNVTCSVGGYGGLPTSGTYSSSIGPVPGGAFFDEFQIPVGIFETSPSNISGYLGQIDFIHWTFNTNTNGVRWDFQRAYMGNTAQATQKLAIPWDSQNKTVPRSGFTRAGISFVRPGPPG